MNEKYTLDEVVRSFSKLSVGKSTNIDGILVDFITKHNFFFSFKLYT